MVELNSGNYAHAKGSGIKKLVQWQYEIEYDKLVADIAKLEEAMKRPGLTDSERRKVNESLWVLKKWLDRSNATCQLAFNERDELECNGDETVIDGFKTIKRIVNIKGDGHSQPVGDIEELCGMTGLMNVKYLKTNGHIIIVDLSSVIDALAFEYNIMDEDLNAHTIDVWTKDATIYTVNEGQIITDMLDGETGGMLKGQLAEIIKQCYVNNLCPKIKLGNDWIVSYIGKSIPLSKTRRNKYGEVLRACCNEITACTLGKISSIELSSRVKWLGLTDNCEYAIEYIGDNIQELLIEFSVIAKVFMKKYRFEPDLYLYNKASDRFVKC